MPGRTLARILAALLFAVLSNAAIAYRWVEHTDSKLASKCPPNGFGGAVYLSTPKPYNFRFYCKNVTAAWSGGAFDPTRDRLYIWGGGHGDYFGNEIYAFDLSSKKTIRLTNPALPIIRLDGPLQSELRPNDGTQPNSRHTYDGLAYMQHIDKMWAFSGSLASGSGGADSVTWLFDPKTNTWRKDNATGDIPRGIVGMVSAYDLDSRRVYVHDRNALYAYELPVGATAGHYTKLSSASPSLRPGGNMVVDTFRRRLFIFGHKNSYSYYIGKGSRFIRKAIATTGARLLVRSLAPGLAFDPIRKEIVGWIGDGKVYRFSADTLAWTLSVVVNGGPGPQHSQGTYGRFAYSPKQDRFVAYNRHNLNAFSLIPWRGEADTTPPTAPASITAVALLPSAMKVSWTASTDNLGIAGYRVFRDGEQVADTTQLQLHELGLKGDTEYEYQVVAYDAAGFVSKPSAVRRIRTPAQTVSLPLGDCASESGLARRSDVVFCEPWEKSNWWQNGYLRDPIVNDPRVAIAKDVARTEIVSDGCVAGKCLRIQTPKGVTNSLSLYWPLKAAQKTPEKLFLRYHLKLGRNWTPSMCDEKGVITGAGGKFPGLADPRTWADPSGQCGNGGNPSNGKNCWTMRTNFRDCGNRSGSACASKPNAITRIGSYLYHFGQNDRWGDVASWDGNPSGQTSARQGTCTTNSKNMFCGSGDGGALVVDKWYRIETQVELNTPGKADGVIRAWIDGVQSFTKTNVQFRTTGHDMLHNRVVWLNVYKGGVQGNCEDSAIFLDQMVLTSEAPADSVVRDPRAESMPRSRAKKKRTAPRSQRLPKRPVSPELELPNGAADTYTDPSTAYPLGAKSFVELDANSNFFLRFPQRKGGRLASATLHLFSEAQKNEMTVGIFRANKAWREAATRSSRAPGHAWDNPLGDWTDRNGVEQGPEPYASERVADTDTPHAISFDVTELVRAWDDGSVKNYGFVIRSIGPRGIHRFASRESSSPERRPRLEYVVR